MTLKRPFQFGKLTLPSNILCAPLAGCSDVPFRRMTAKYRPGLMYCEMVKMDALVRQNVPTLRYLDYEPAMRPIGGQLCGSKPEIAGACAKIIEDLGFDVVDLNCGCPVDKVTKDGSGSAMLKNPEQIGEIIANMVAAVKIPVTVKIRVGWDEDTIVAPQVTRIAEQAGASAICIHGRTRAQAYKGPAKWEYIRECKKAATTIKVIGNGDVFDPISAEEIFTQTGCDAILLARGLMGQPWLIEDIHNHLAGKPPIKRTGIDLRDAFMEHLAHIVSYQLERKAILDVRRIGCWFLRNGSGVRELRDQLNRTQSIKEIYQLVENYAWEDIVLTPPQREAEEACDSDGC